MILSGASTNPVAEREQAETQQAIANSLADIAATNREEAERAQGTKETEPCEPGDDRRYSDLCAQWKAADAAEVAAWLSGASFAAVLVALFFAFQSNRIARETAKRQLRAYIAIEPGGVNEAIDGKHRVPLNIINTGQTPARDLELFGDFLIVTGNPREFDPKEHGRFSGELASTDHSIGGQSNRWTFSYLDREVPKPFWERLAKKEAAIVHYGFLQYKDVFGETWRTGFAFYHWGEELSDLETKRCRLGNYAT